MRLGMIALSQTRAADTWVEASDDGLTIHASRRWLEPLLSEYQRDLSVEIHCPMRQLEPALLHLALLLHKETWRSNVETGIVETSAYALEIARVLSIHVLRTHY